MLRLVFLIVFVIDLFISCWTLRVRDFGRAPSLAALGSKSEMRPTVGALVNGIPSISLRPFYARWCSCYSLADLDCMRVSRRCSSSEFRNDVDRPLRWLSLGKSLIYLFISFFNFSSL